MDISPRGRWSCLAPPDPAASLAELGYKQALEQYSRQVLAAGYAQGKGQIAEASRLLGITPASLRAKLKGLLSGAEE
ncbi:MAG TPA: helix-turn-helix domain-containing protein [Thermoanaerobaculia bacterium]|nr:helix-turn-helix domain-containing protein [Thermoanaerobaculia bacterium]